MALKSPAVVTLLSLPSEKRIHSAAGISARRSIAKAVLIPDGLGLLPIRIAFPYKLNTSRKKVRKNVLSV